MDLLLFVNITHPAYLWNDALLSRLLLAHHGVGFPCPCLAVGKDTHVVALEGMLKHFLPNVQIDLPLRGKARVLRLFPANTNISQVPKTSPKTVHTVQVHM